MSWFSLRAIHGLLRHKSQSGPSVAATQKPATPVRPVLSLTIAQVLSLPQLDMKFGPLTLKQWYFELENIFAIFQAKNKEKPIYRNINEFLADDKCFRGWVHDTSNPRETMRYTFQMELRTLLNRKINELLGLPSEKEALSYCLAFFELASARAHLLQGGDQQTRSAFVLETVNKNLEKLLRHLPENVQITF